MATVTEHPDIIAGSFPNEATVKITSPGTTTLDVVMKQMHRIQGIKSILILDSGNRVATSDVDVTFATNVVTIADGGTYSLTDTHVIYLTVFGSRKR